MSERRYWDELSTRKKIGTATTGALILTVLFGCGTTNNVAEVVAAKNPDVYKLVIVGTGDSYSILAAECAPGMSYLDLQELNNGKGLFAGDTVNVPSNSSCITAESYETKLRASCDIVQTPFAKLNDNPDSLSSEVGIPTAAFVRLNDLSDSRAVLQQGQQYWRATNCRNGFDPWKLR